MSRAPQPYDLVIVGASFAGLAAAKTAAMRGLKVAVLEAKPSAGHSVKTAGILFNEAAEEVDIPHALTRRVYGVRLYAPNLKHVDLFAPGSFFLTTETGRLLDWLAQEAMRAGRANLVADGVRGGRKARRSFRIFGRQHLGPAHSRRRWRAVSRSRVASDLGRNQRFLTGIEVEYDHLEKADPRFLHCFLDSELAPGYLAWVAPGPSVFHAGVAAGRGRRPHLRAFLRKTEAHFRLRATHAPSPGGWDAFPAAAS